MESKRTLILYIAFTLSVLMLVGVAVCGLYCWLFMPFCNTPPHTDTFDTKVQLKTLHAAVNMFKLDTGRYPSQEKGLIELIVQPADVTGWNPSGYLESTDVPRDAWKHEFIYKLAPADGKPFVIISYGADGVPGGIDENADLASTDMY